MHFSIDQYHFVYHKSACTSIYLRIWCDSFTFCQRVFFFTHPVHTIQLDINANKIIDMTQVPACPRDIRIEYTIICNDTMLIKSLAVLHHICTEQCILQLWEC